jgi:hypothetical protein
MEPNLRQETTASTSSRLSVFTRRPRRESSNDNDNDVKGPLGLNTLYDPPLPAIADLIFVHGFAGGSRSTWSKNHDPNLFWPQEWLPKDNKFQDVRIHSFGYNTNWEKDSILNIYDFAKSLLGCIYDCPLIPGESNVRSLSMLSSRNIVCMSYIYMC